LGDVSTTLRFARHDGDFFDEGEDEEGGFAALLILYLFLTFFIVMSSEVKRSRDISYKLLIGCFGSQ
jgi:hypothetical protein